MTFLYQKRFHIQWSPEAYLEPCQTSMMDCVVKIMKSC